MQQQFEQQTYKPQEYASAQEHAGSPDSVGGRSYTSPQEYTPYLPENNARPAATRRQRTARPIRRSTISRPNVDTLERQVSVALGSGLVLYSLINRGRGFASIFTGALGAALVLHGQSKRSPFYNALEINTSGQHAEWQRREDRNRFGQGRDGEQRPMPSNTIEIERAVTVDKPAGELYNYWRKLENLPNFMEHLKEVKQTEGNQSHWVAKLAGGLPVSWDAEIVEDVPGERIVWRTLPDSTVEQRGKVEFKPANGERGTVVHVDIQYSPPGGIVGETFAQLLNGVTAQQVKDDIRRFKSLMETGEIPTVEGQPSGRS